MGRQKSMTISDKSSQECDPIRQRHIYDEVFYHRSEDFFFRLTMSCVASTWWASDVRVSVQNQMMRDGWRPACTRVGPDLITGWDPNVSLSLHEPNVAYLAWSLETRMYTSGTRLNNRLGPRGQPLGTWTKHCVLGAIIGEIICTRVRLDFLTSWDQRSASEYVNQMLHTWRDRWWTRMYTSGTEAGLQMSASVQCVSRLASD